MLETISIDTFDNSLRYIYIYMYQLGVEGKSNYSRANNDPSSTVVYNTGEECKFAIPLSRHGDVTIPI